MAREEGGSVKLYLGVRPDSMVRASLLKNFSGRGRPGQSQPLTLSLHPMTPMGLCLPVIAELFPDLSPRQRAFRALSRGAQVQADARACDQDMLVTWRFRSRLDLEKFI